MNKWCQRMGEQHGEWVHGEWINGDIDVGTDVQPGDETQVSYQSSTATLKDVDEEERRSRSRIQRWRPMRLTMSRFDQRR